MTNKKPKILIYDIETTPNIGYVWGRYDQTVLAYKQERELLSIAYKWYGESTVYCLTRKGESSDKRLVIKARALLEAADITVAHNGDAFDRKILKTRMIKHGLKPIKVNCSVDTRNSARAYFAFNGNSLSDLCSFLKIGKKLETNGIGLWLDCMASFAKDIKASRRVTTRQIARAWRKMTTYNRHDVLLLDKLYTHMLPWIENHPNVARLINHRLDVKSYTGHCPTCLSKRLQRNGVRPMTMGLRQRWGCLNCGKRFLTAISATKV